MQFFILFHCIGETIFFQKVLLPDSHIFPEAWMLNTSHNSEQFKHNKGTVVEAKMQGLSEVGETVWVTKEGGRIEAIQASASQSMCFCLRRAVTGFTLVGGKANTVKH